MDQSQTDAATKVFDSLIVECLLSIGTFGDLGSGDLARADRLTEQAVGRLKAAETAEADGNTLAGSMRRSAEAIAAAAEKARVSADAARAGAPKYVGYGIFLVALLHITTGFVANSLLAHKFRQWRANQSLPHGLPMLRVLFVIGLVLFAYPLAIYRFAFDTSPDWLIKFPAALGLRNSLSIAIDEGVAWLADNFSLFFVSIKEAINAVLKAFCLNHETYPAFLK